MADFTRPYRVAGLGLVRSAAELALAIKQTRQNILAADADTIAEHKRLLRRLQRIQNREESIPSLTLQKLTKAQNEQKATIAELKQQLAMANKELQQLKRPKRTTTYAPMSGTLATHKGQVIQAKWGYNHNIIHTSSNRHDIAGIVLRSLYASGAELVKHLGADTASQLHMLAKHAPMRPVQALVRSAKSAPPPTDNWQHIITPHMSLEYRIKPAYYDATIAP